VLPDGDVRRPGAIDPRPVLAQVARARVTRITTSPALVERLVASSHVSRSGAPSGLRGVRIVTGGGPVFPDLIERATAATGAELVAVYGSTEAEPIAHVSSAAIGAEEIADMRAGAGLLAGHPVPETKVCIVPASVTDGGEVEALLAGRRRPVAGTRGEIVVSGRHVVPGYLHGRGDAGTKIRVNGVVWHRTGDAGYLDADGRLWLLGRVRGAIADARGVLYPFAVETAARLLIPGRRSVLAAHRGRRVLLVEGALDEADRASLEQGLRWASLDRIVDDVEIPLDRRHNSKVDYAALGRVLERRDRPNAR
jgi:acyl-CoA synthetase (AMP-forming)/AMP-acid ligase II